MRSIKGISMLTIVVLIFHIFGLNAGILATSDPSTSNEVMVEYVTHSDEDIQWNLGVDVTGESEESEVEVEVHFSPGLSRGSIDVSKSVDVEQTTSGYVLKSAESIQEEVEITTVRTDDLVDTYQVEAVATFDEQTIEDFAEKSIELPVVTQSTEEELNEQADDVSFDSDSDEEDAEQAESTDEVDEADTDQEAGSSEEESQSEGEEESSEVYEETDEDDDFEEKRRVLQKRRAKMKVNPKKQRRRILLMQRRRRRC